MVKPFPSPEPVAPAAAADADRARARQRRADRERRSPSPSFLAPNPGSGPVPAPRGASPTPLPGSPVATSASGELTGLYAMAAPAPPAQAPASPASAGSVSTLICPITRETMVDPVSAADGHTYERSHIKEWLRAHATSPITRERLENKVLLVNWLVRAMIERDGFVVAPSPVVREEVGARNGGARTPIIKLRGVLNDDSTAPAEMDWKFRGNWWTEVDGRRVSDKFRFEYSVSTGLDALLALVFSSATAATLDFSGHFQYVTGGQDGSDRGVSLVAHVRDGFALAPVAGSRALAAGLPPSSLPLYGDGRSAHGRYAQRAILARRSGRAVGAQFTIDISRVYSDRLVLGAPFQPPAPAPEAAGAP